MEDLEGRREQFDAVVAPVDRAIIGSVSVHAETMELVRLPIVIEAVERGGVFRRAGGAIGRAFRRIFGDEQAVEGSDLEPAP
jgi:hypothetical protein